MKLIITAAKCLLFMAIGVIAGRYWRIHAPTANDVRPIFSITPRGDVFHIDIPAGVLNQGTSFSVNFDSLFRGPGRMGAVWCIEEDGKVVGVVDSSVILEENEITHYPSQTEWVKIKEKLRL